VRCVRPHRPTRRIGAQGIHGSLVLLYTWPWAARPGPKFPGQARPDHACGPGLGQIFWPDSQHGPGLGHHFARFKEAAQPEARGPMGFPYDGPGLGQDFRPDGRAGPGLGPDFPLRALISPARGPARPEKCSGIPTRLACIGVFIRFLL
jgi:hypothetical protein